MILKISANPEIEQDCPIVISDIIIDMNKIGAEQVARDFINCVRFGINIYDRVSANDVIIAIKEKPKNLIGVELDWSV